LSLLLSFGLNGNLNASFVPENGQMYYIVHSSSLLLGDDSGVKISFPSGSNNQYFKFIDRGSGYYNIQVVSTGQYLMKDGRYSLTWGSDATSGLAQFNVIDLDDYFVNIEVKDFNGSVHGRLGSDARTSGSSIYSDKSGLDKDLHYWTIKLVGASGELVKFVLEDIIATTQEFLDEAPKGNGEEEYTQEVCNEFQSAINVAQSALLSVSQNEINQAVEMLLQAQQIFISKKTPKVFVEHGKTYYIIHSSGNFFGLPSDAGESVRVQLQEPQAISNLQYKFTEIENEAGTYYMQRVSDNKYVCTPSSYFVYLRSDVANGKIKMFDAGNGFAKIQFAEKTGNNYLGTNDGTPGQIVGANSASDKNGTNVNHFWTIKEVIPGELLRDALQITISTGNRLLNSVEIGEDSHMYKQEVHDAFSMALNEAENALETAQTQEEINAAVNALKQAQETFLANSNPVVFVWEEGAKYRIVTRKYMTSFLASNSNDAKAAENWETGNIKQHWELQKVTNKDHTYKLVNNGKALDVNYNLVDISNAQEWVIQHNATVNGIDYFAVLADNSTIACSQGKTWVTQTHVTTNDAHHTRIIKVDEAHDPTKLALENYIPGAIVTLNSKIIGTEQGQWSQGAYDTFRAVINQAKDVVLGNGYTQSEVDEMLSVLRNAESLYQTSPISVEKEDLKAQLDLFKELINGAQIGNQIGEYKLSVIEAHKTAYNASMLIYNKSSVQEDIDAEVPIVTEKINAFKEAANTTIIPMAEVIDEMIPAAYALYENSVEGVDKGQYFSSIRSAYKESIDTLKEIVDGGDADETTLIALNEAMFAFSNAVIKTDRSALRTALSKASLALEEGGTPGNLNGQRPQDKFDLLSTAITDAQDVFDNIESTQENLDAASSLLNAAFLTFNKSIVTVDFSALDASLSIAARYKNTTTLIGNEPGYFPQDKYDTFCELYDSIVNMDRTVSQETADQLTASMNAAINSFVAQLKLQLVSVIEEATSLHNEAIEGTAPGNYEFGAKAALMNAITRATSARNNQEGTQETFFSASKALKNAILLFERKIISSVHEVNMPDLKVYVVNNLLHIRNMKGINKIVIYNMSGSTLYSETANSELFEIHLNSGVYIVKIQSAIGSYTATVTSN